MDIEIRPSKKYYIIPLLFLLIGGYLFSQTFTALIDSLSNDMLTIVPDQSITIEVEEGDSYYIMMDVFSRQNTIFYQGNEYSGIIISNSYNSYTVEFTIYEEGNPSNFILAKGMSPSTSMSINDYEAIMTVDFIEAGTYVISTDIIETDYPDFTFAITDTNIFYMIGMIFLTIFLVLVTFGGAIISYSKIHSKRARAKRELENQYSYKPQNSFDYFDNY